MMNEIGDTSQTLPSITIEMPLVFARWAAEERFRLEEPLYTASQRHLYSMNTCETYDATRRREKGVR